MSEDQEEGMHRTSAYDGPWTRDKALGVLRADQENVPDQLNQLALDVLDALDSEPDGTAVEVISGQVSYFDYRDFDTKGESI